MADSSPWSYGAHRQKQRRNVPLCCAILRPTVTFTGRKRRGYEEPSNSLQFTGWAKYFCCRDTVGVVFCDRPHI